jgi:hypothetical protein
MAVLPPALQTLSLVHMRVRPCWSSCLLCCNFVCCNRAMLRARHLAPGPPATTGAEVYSHLLELSQLRQLTVWPPPPQSDKSDFWCDDYPSVDFFSLSARA